MFVVPGCQVGPTCSVTAAKDFVNGIQSRVIPVGFCRRGINSDLGINLNLARLRQLHPFQWPKHPVLVNCLNRFHLSPVNTKPHLRTMPLIQKHKFLHIEQHMREVSQRLLTGSPATIKSFLRIQKLHGKAQFVRIR